MKKKYTYQELEQELQNSHKRLKEIQQITHLGYWELDIINNKLTWSDEIYRIFNLNPQKIEATCENILAKIHPKDRDMVNEVYLNSLKDKTPYLIEYRLLLPLGEVKYVLERCKTYYNGKGVPVHLIGTILDITNQYKLKETLRKSEEKYRAIVENTSDWIWEMDGTGAITYSNSVVEKILGYSSVDLIGKNNIALIHKLDRKRIAQVFLEKVKQKEGWNNLELRWVHKNGSYRYFESSAIPILNEQGILQVFRGVNRDITESKRIELQLKKSVELTRSITQSAGDSIISINSDGIILSWNNASEKIFEYKASEMINKNLERIMVIKDAVSHREGLKRQKKNNKIKLIGKSFETIGVRKDGTKFPLDLNVSSWIVDNKKYYTGIIRDITERKNAEIDIRRLNIAVNNSVNEVYVFDAITLKFSYANTGGTNNLGRTFEELKNMTPLDIKPEFTFESFSTILEPLYKGEVNNLQFQTIHQRKDKTTYPVEVNLSKFTSDNKSHFLALIIDITERKKAESENKKLFTVVEQSANTIIITGINGKIEYTNPRFTEVSGYTAKEALGNYPRILKSGKHSKEYYTQLWKTIKSGKIWKGEFQNKAKNGKLFWEQATITPIKNDEGEIINYLSIREDITIQKKAEKELNIALIKAKESDKLKSLFLANMSHEIRTPMNSIIGFSEFLLKSNLPENKRKDYAEIIITNSKRLLTIVNDILDISKIEAGVVQLNYQSVNVNKMLNDLYVFYKPIAIENNLILTCKLGLENFKSVIHIDRTKLNQILTNLLSNAIKFTNEGEVEFGYKLIKNNLQFYVKDTGEGIDKKLKNKIFDRFFQGGIDLTKQSVGTGLGLAISKNFVELFNGEIWFTSSEKGTTVYFTIPYTKKKTHLTSTVFANKKEQIKQEIKEKNKETTILVAEDEEYNMMYINVLFSKTNFKIIEANNGKQAVELFKKHSEIDLVLMDIQMPIMNGNEAMKEIKKMKPSIPVIALSAFAMESDKEEALKKGFDFYISKPIDKKLLFNTIKECT